MHESYFSNIEKKVNKQTVSYNKNLWNIETITTNPYIKFIL